MHKTDAIDAFTNLIDAMKKASVIQTGQFITLVQAAPSNDKEVRIFKQDGSQFLKDIGQKIGRFEIERKLLGNEAHHEYTLNSAVGIERFMGFVNNEAAKFKRLREHWDASVEYHAERLGFE